MASDRAGMTERQRILDELAWRYSRLPYCVPALITLEQAQQLAARYLQRYRWVMDEAAAVRCTACK